MSLTCGMWQAASGKFIMMIVSGHQKNILSMYEFDMWHAAGGKRQVYYNDRNETSKEIIINL